MTPTVTISGNLSECGLFKEDIPTDKGSIGTVSMKVVSITPKGRLFHQLKKLSSCGRFSVINAYYQNTNGKEVFAGELIDTKLDVYFGISATNTQIILSPRLVYDQRSAEDFAKLVAKLFCVSVVISPGSSYQNVVNLVKHPELLLSL
ncbi:MAG: hypothetical protein JRN21_09695 [Nitrososphaerota archaeon]|nr:hypothetical protein [Nitrososphaerota archaeon]